MQSVLDSIIKERDERKEKLASLFSFIDTDGNGNLDPEELAVLLKLLKGHRNATLMGRNSLFEKHKMDPKRKDKVGETEFVDFMYRMSEHYSEAEFEEKVMAIRYGRRGMFIESLFHIWDTDGNGSLDLKEFTAMMSEICGDTNPRSVLKKFVRMDKNRDMRISMDEYETSMLLTTGNMDDKHFYSKLKKLKVMGRKVRSEKKA